MEVTVEAEDRLKDNESAIEALESSAAVRKITLHWPDSAGNLHPVEFTQAPLGMFPAQEFVTMMTRVIKDVLDGKYDVDVMELLKDRKRLQEAQMPSEIDEDSIEAVAKEWMPYIQAFLKLTDIIPGLQQDIIALSLGVRRKHREEFKENIAEAPHLGGLDIPDGVEILKVFIRQNVKVLKRFLGRQLREIGDEIVKALEIEEKKEDTTGGMQSSITSAPTPEPV